MTLSADTPLYNHPLPDIEDWLRSLGCEQDRQELHHWSVERPQWTADIWLDVDRLVVRYDDKNSNSGSDEDRSRSFQYSLSREDIENAVFGEGVEQALFGTP